MLFNEFLETYWDLCGVCSHPRKVGLIACASERCRCNGCHLNVEFKVIMPRMHGRTEMMEELRKMQGVGESPAEERRSSDEEHSPVTREVTGSSPAGAAKYHRHRRDGGLWGCTDVHDASYYTREVIEKRNAGFKDIAAGRTRPWSEVREEIFSFTPFWKGNYGRTFNAVEDINDEHLKNIALYLAGRVNIARPGHGMKHWKKLKVVRAELAKRRSATKFEEELKGSPFGLPVAKSTSSSADTDAPLGLSEAEDWRQRWGQRFKNLEAALVNQIGYAQDMLKEGQVPGTAETPSLRPAGSTPAACANFELVKALVHFWTRDVGFLVGDPADETQVEQYVLQHFENWPIVARGGTRRMEVVKQIVKKLGQMLSGPCGDCGSACEDGCLGEQISSPDAELECECDCHNPSCSWGNCDCPELAVEEDAPEFLIGWTDDETAVKDLTAVIDREYERQSEFGMYPGPKDLAIALVQSFREDEPEHDEIPEVDLGMFSPWSKDEYGRSDGV